QIDLADVRKIRVDNLNVERGIRLQTVEHVETAPAALAFGRVGRVCDLLQFAQDKLRDDDRAAQESGLGYVCDAPVNDDRRVENLHVVADRFVAEDAA